MASTDTVSDSAADESQASSESQASTFAEQAHLAPPGLMREFWDFLRYNKKWWLTPIVLVLMLLGTLVLLSSTAAAPFIYTMF